MKKIVVLLLITLVSLSGCSSSSSVDITPALSSIEKVVIQRTDVNDGEYTYYEKVLTDAAQIESFCTVLDDLKFAEHQAIQYDSCDYLIIFEGPVSKKIIFYDDYIILSQGTCKFENKELLKEISNIYQSLTPKETKATPRFLEIE